MRLFFLSLFFICLAFASNAWGQCTGIYNLRSTGAGISVTITWEDNCPETKYYYFKLKTRESADWSTMSIRKNDSGVQQLHITNLLAFVCYDLRIESCDTTGINRRMTAPTYEQYCQFRLTDYNPQLPCNDPLGIQVNNITRTQAVISWRNETNASQYVVYVRPVGGSITAHPGVSNTRTIPNLRPNTEYEFRIRTFCPNNRMSPYTSWRRFRTN